MNFTAQATYTGRKFHCIVTDANGETATSGEALLTVQEPAALMEITGPADVTVEPDGTATFHVEVSGGTAPYTYKWEVLLPTKAAYQSTKLGGWNTDTMNFTAQATYTGRKFHCIVTDANGETATSGEALLTVESSEIVINDVVYAELSDTAMYVKAYIGSAISVEVLGEVNNLPVEEIGAEAFMGNTSIQSIDLPDSIKVIRERAFKNCINLKEMN